MKIKLFNNLWLKVLSVMAAMLLWLIVVNIDDAVSSRDFKSIKVSIENTDVLTEQGQTCRVEDGTDVVDITVYARRSVLNKLQSSDFKATADVSKDLLYNGLVGITVTYTGDSQVSRQIEKIEQNRTNVALSIEESVTEQFKVTVRTTGNASDGLTQGPSVPERTLVDITGPKSVIEQIKLVCAQVDITGITGTAIRTTTLELYDAAGNEIDDTYLDYTGKGEPFSVTVSTLNTKLVGISFDISEAAPEGYGVSAITYKPETVTIAGLLDVIDPIANLEIPPEALNPDGSTGTVEQVVDISQYLDDGITIPSEDEHEIVVTMEITPYTEASYVLSGSQIQYLNVPDGYEPDVSEAETLEIVVSGLESELTSLAADSITVSADLTGCRRAGTYNVPVTVTVPDGFTAPEDLTMDVKLVKSEE